jgi:prepilin peptidase CpaA
VSIPTTAGILTTLLFVTTCIVVDVRTLRIPNALTGPAVAAGIALNAWSFGWGGLAASVSGLALAVALLLAPFALGGIGGGDVKMMGAVGALIGPQLVLSSLFLGLVLGGVFAVARLASMRRLREKLAATWHMAAAAALSRSVDPLRAPGHDPNAVVLPYSLPLGLGTVGVIALSVVGK